MREAADGRRAMRLEGDAEHNLLTRLLEDDPHVGPFLAIPGKDNGFDIEGLALDGRRLLLGLRGPVLRGWTRLLELAIEPAGDWLRLAPLDGEGTMLRKHFLQLGGLGVRDLHFAGVDLYILAGPTMVLDGEIRPVPLAGSTRCAGGGNREPVRFQQAFAAHGRVAALAGSRPRRGLLRAARGLVRGVPAWLVLYDAPGEGRREGDRVVFGDLLRRD